MISCVNLRTQISRLGVTVFTVVMSDAPKPGQIRRVGVTVFIVLMSDAPKPGQISRVGATV